MLVLSFKLDFFFKKLNSLRRELIAGKPAAAGRRFVLFKVGRTEMEGHKKLHDGGVVLLVA